MAVLTLVAAVLCMALWVVFTFIMPVGLGVVHGFLGLGVFLLIRWWASRGDAPSVTGGA
jgi:hypothetical protein